MLKKYASFYYMPNKKTRIKRYNQYDHQKENNYKRMFSKLFILSVN